MREGVRLESTGCPSQRSTRLHIDIGEVEGNVGEIVLVGGWSVVRTMSVDCAMLLVQPALRSCRLQVGSSVRNARRRRRRLLIWPLQNLVINLIAVRVRGGCLVEFSGVCGAGLVVTHGVLMVVRELAEVVKLSGRWALGSVRRRQAQAG